MLFWLTLPQCNNNLQCLSGNKMLYRGYSEVTNESLHLQQWRIALCDIMWRICNLLVSSLLSGKAVFILVWQYFHATFHCYFSVLLIHKTFQNRGAGPIMSVFKSASSGTNNTRFIFNLPKGLNLVPNLYCVMFYCGFSLKRHALIHIQFRNTLCDARIHSNPSQGTMYLLFLLLIVVIIVSSWLVAAVSHVCLHSSLMSRCLQVGHERSTHHRLLREGGLRNVGHWWMCIRWHSFMDSKPLWSGCRHTEKYAIVFRCKTFN